MIRDMRGVKGWEGKKKETYRWGEGKGKATKEKKGQDEWNQQQRWMRAYARNDNAMSKMSGKMPEIVPSLLPVLPCSPAILSTLEWLAGKKLRLLI